jgi:recombination protein RecT
LLLLQDGAQGLEVLMTRRSLRASFVPGAFVFPGGMREPADADCASVCSRRPGQSDAALAEAVAAIRETFEELGVLLARRADGRWISTAELAGLSRHASLPELCRSHGLTLACAELHLLARWETDRDLPKRFEVPFFVAAMPPGQTPLADEVEQFEPQWVRPADALARQRSGQFPMIFPTIRTLEHLAGYATVDAVLDACRASEAPLWTSCPRSGLRGGHEVRFMAHEAPFAELALVCPDGQIVHPLDWQTQRPVALLKNVQRLTAPNPGAMTGPGTNSYLVGDATTGFAVIDPGPADADHLQRLWQAAGGDIRCIICTHSHPDHSPGALPLQTLCPSRPLILGLPSAATAHVAHHFVPDRALQDNELITLIPQGLEGNKIENLASGHTLRVIHTPGHAANHVCLLLQEDGLLFSGDHILGGSTPVVDPPDGNMSDYLASLARLRSLCEAAPVHYILPAHGHVLGGPGDEALAVIERLRAHRLAREARLLAAMQAQPTGSLDDWLAEVYADVPERMWPVARRSLLAHLERIQALGLTPPSASISARPSTSSASSG